VARQGPKRKLPAIPAVAPNPCSIAACRHCGKGSHPRHLCPAKEAQYFCCNSVGHFSSQCVSTTVASTTESLQEVTTESSRADKSDNAIAYLDTLGGSKKVWEIDVNVNGTVVTFKVDKGAEVTAFSDARSLGIATPLKKAGLSLFAPDQTPLNFL